MAVRIGGTKVAESSLARFRICRSRTGTLAPGARVIDAIGEVTRPRQLVNLGLPNLELPESELRTQYEDWLDEQRHQAMLSNLEPLIEAGLITDYEFSPSISDLLEKWPYILNLASF